MYQLLRRPEGRPWATPSDWLTLSASDPLPAEQPLVVLMRENRSTLGHDKPADLGKYVELFGTPIIGLTGNEAQLDRIKKGTASILPKSRNRAATTPSTTPPRFT
ncbi:MAG: hypothetical protein ABL931_17895 [Usitatibacteraceae bacterium]